jgi:hypothetical protein|tara:strand:- start:215 stop:652 length:438 start_codon:yes stop_codon:yes gene_type:complete
MKSSPQKFAQYRTHHEIDIDIDEEFWPMMGILFTIWGIWTGVVHLADWLTFDTIVWWAEPFTILPFVFLLIMTERYGSLNPLHWWPMFFGYKIKLPDEDRVKIYPIDGADLIKKHGGLLNVHIVDYEHIKFRRKCDAVIFSLKNF